MTKATRREVSLGPLFLLLTVFLTVRCDEGFREDELECERAAVHVEECCPGVAHGHVFACEYQEAQACSAAVDPPLTVSQGQCLRGTSCVDLVASGTCAALVSGATSGKGKGGASGAEDTSPSGILARRTVCR